MSNINIENLSHDMNMDREAMDAIAGSGIRSWFSKLASKAGRYLKANYVPILRGFAAYLGRRYGSPSPRR
jgi:hypothetical protein